MKKSSCEQPRFFIKPICAAILLACTTQAVHANPTGASVANGQASFATSGNTLTVTNTPGAIINWQGFSIGANEVTRFVQQSAASTVLNRVVSSNPSSILGSLQSNGRVFLVNPNGIIFGAGSTIDVAGLVATTLKLGDADFLAGRHNFSAVPGAQNISNAGNITAQSGGQIYLIAPNVENRGVITAPNGEILLAAGHSVELVDSANPNLRVNITAPAGDATNVGQLVASSGSLGLFGTVVRNSGTASADSATLQGGKIVFKASQRAEISGNVSANGTSGGTIEALGKQVGIMDGATVSANGAQGGGTVLVGGDYQGKNPDVPNAQVTYVAPTANISADATDNGNGGKVIVWADDTMRAYGNISARGGANGGDGGFIETSAHWLDLAGIRINAAAPNGSAGTWLLDPWDLTVSGSATTATYAAGTWSSGSGATNVLNTAINVILDAGTNVTLQTTGVAADGNGNGNITVNAPINKAVGPATSISLQAHNDIIINQGIGSSGGALNITLTADSDTNNAGAVFINKQLNSNGGNIIASAYGNIQLNDGISTNLLAGSGNVTLTSTGGLIDGDPMGGPLDIQANSVSLTAKNGIAANGGAAQFHVNATNISFNNTTAGGVIIYNNHAGASSFTGSNTGGTTRLESFDSANPATVSSITSAGDIVFRMNKLAIAGPVNAGANTVFIAPFTNNTISIGGANSFNLTGTDISSITAGKIVIGNDSLGNYAPTVNIATSAAVSVTNAANLEIWGGTINTGAPGFTNAGGQVALVGDAMNLGGTVDSGLVWLRGKSFSQHIDLGGSDAGGVVGLTSAELNQINASTLRIGSMTGSGNINVSTAIAPAGISTLSLEAGGGITQGAPGTISASNLAIKVLGNVALDTAANIVTNLAAQVGDGTHQNNNIRFKNGVALNIANAIDSVTGININIDGAGFNSASPNGVIALTSNLGITQSAGALLAGKAVYAEGSRVMLTEANPTGVIAGKSTGVATGDIFNYTSNNGIAVTTVNGFSGIQTNGVIDLIAIQLSAGNAGISQDLTAPILAGSGLLLNTTGPVNLGASANAVVALGTGSSTGAFSFYNSAALTLGVSGNGISTANQLVNISANGLLTVKDGVSAGTGSVALEAPDIQIGVTATPGTTINGGFIKLRTNKTAAAGMISTAGTTASTLTSSTGIALETDNLNFPVAPVLNANSEVAFRTFTDNRSITVGNACNGADPSCLLIGGATINAPDLVIGNEIVTDTNTSGNIHIDAAITHTYVPASKVALLTGGTIDQTAAITTTGLGVSAGSTVTLNANNSVTDLVGKSNGSSFSFTNGQSLNIASMSGGAGPFAYSMSGIAAPGGVNVQTTGAATDIVLNNAVSSVAVGNAVVLAAGGNFINNVGAAGISTPNGRWLVYSTDPASNTFNGLNSGNTAVWNTTIAGTPPASVSQLGKHYLFSYQPTATFTSISGSKTYGADATTAVAGAYSVSGINAGVLNAYLADTNATAFSGTPSVTSGGSLGTAAVAGSPYAINTAQGSLSALNGYALAYASPGLLTINTAPLTVTANVANKTYDGLAYSGGNGVVYTGFVSNDTSAVLGGALAYSGTSQGAVNAGSYLIAPNGLTSGNYTITYVDGALTVNPAALTIEANGFTKDYDELAYSGGNGVVYSGFVNSETSAVLSGTLAYAGSAQGAIDAGDYLITPSGLTGDNYAINYVDGILTVNPLVAAPVIDALVSDVSNMVMPDADVGADDISPVDTSDETVPTQDADNPPAEQNDDEKDDEQTPVDTQGAAGQATETQSVASLPVCK